MKIVYCTNNVSHVGGIPKVLAVKANALAERYGHEVYVAESDHGEALPESAVFSPAVRFIDLDIHYDRLPEREMWNPRGCYRRAVRLHRRRLKAALREINPDVVVSLGGEEKFFLPYIRGRWKTVREFHWTTDIRQTLYGCHSRFNHIVAKLADFADRHLFLSRFDRIVLLSEYEKRALWSGNDRVCVIPNPQTLGGGSLSPLSAKRFVAAGRLQYQKNYESMIRIFALVHGRCPEWRLDIYGDGPDRESLQLLITSLGLEGAATLRGNTGNMAEVLSEASCFLLTSRWEGMPLVVIEAMTFGLPVVSYDCPSGPKDLIEEGVNGFLIPCGDEEAFASKVVALAEDERLRRRLGEASARRAELYAPEKIMARWQEFFENLCR